MIKPSLFFIALLLLTFISCTKSTFLEKKPNTTIVIPNSLDDMTQLLDNQNITLFNSPAIGFLSADEYYYPTQESFDAAYTMTEKNCYLWNKDIYAGEKNISDWNAPYKAIFYTNVVLEAWNKLSIENKESEKGKFVKAWALFDRSYNYFNLVQIFSLPYDQNTGGKDLGVPLKLSADINDIQQRATVQETYDRILSDLTTAINLFEIPISSNNINRPSKSAGYALLARVYFYMRKYDKAMQATDSSLAIYNNLIDYNTIDPNADEPFGNHNGEVLYKSMANLDYTSIAVNPGYAIIDTSLINLYEENDLRKYIFFHVDNTNYFMKSGYNGTTGFPLVGLATDELYLIKAECQARSMDLNGSLETLNKLLVNRYKTGAYSPIGVRSQAELLKTIINERRKELVWRGLRWQDIKRLNKEGYNIVLKRVLEGTVYTLAPNDPRYVMPIPDDEIALSHIQQNTR